MANPPSLAELLKRGSAELNKLRKEDKLPQDFTGATLVRLFCANADLSGLELTGSEWDRCELSKVDFRNADLSNAYFQGGRFDDCDFRGANLEGATLEKVRLARCDFTDAKGLDEVELTDVDMHEVIGLDEDDDEDASEGEPAGEPLVLLRDRLPKGFRRLPLEDLLTEIAKVVSVELGDRGTEADVSELESAMNTKFPADYRAFLMRFGSLRVIGSSAHARGFFNVFGIGDLESTRLDFLVEMKEAGFDPDWLDVKSPHDAPGTTGTLAARRTKLRDSLKLADVHVKHFFGDKYDAMRVAYQYLVPVMAVPDELPEEVDCVGPDTQMYTVHLSESAIEPPSGTFTSRLLMRLESVVVGPAES